MMVFSFVNCWTDGSCISTNLTGFNLEFVTFWPCCDGVILLWSYIYSTFWRHAFLYTSQGQFSVWFLFKTCLICVLLVLSSLYGLRDWDCVDFSCMCMLLCLSSPKIIIFPVMFFLPLSGFLFMTDFSVAREPYWDLPMVAASWQYGKDGGCNDVDVGGRLAKGQFLV